MQFAHQAFTKGQLLAFRFLDEKQRVQTLNCEVHAIQGERGEAGGEWSWWYVVGVAALDLNAAANAMANAGSHATTANNKPKSVRFIHPLDECTSR
jgi:hypothetical protein